MELSACFIAGMATTIDTLTRRADITGYAVYTPIDSDGR
jgi:hypothetical protein